MYRLYVVKKLSKEGKEFFVLGCDTDIEKGIWVSLDETVILKVADMKKSELIALVVDEKHYLN